MIEQSARRRVSCIIVWALRILGALIGALVAIVAFIVWCDGREGLLHVAVTVMFGARGIAALMLFVVAAIVGAAVLYAWALDAAKKGASE